MTDEYNLTILAARQSQASYFSLPPIEILTHYIFPYIHDAFKRIFERVMAWNSLMNLLVCDPELVPDVLFYIKYAIVAHQDTTSILDFIATDITLCYQRKPIDMAENMIVTIFSYLSQKSLHKPMNIIIDRLILGGKVTERLYSNLLAVRASAFMPEHYENLRCRLISLGRLAQNEYVLGGNSPQLTISPKLIDSVAHLIMCYPVSDVQATFNLFARHRLGIYDRSHDIWTSIICDNYMVTPVDTITYLYDNGVLQFSNTIKLHFVKLLRNKTVDDVPRFLLDLDEAPETNLDQLMTQITSTTDTTTIRELIRQHTHHNMIKVFNVGRN